MLRVLVPVSKPFVRLTAAAAAEGTEVALTCTVREGTAPLSFSWQHREPHGGLLAAPTGLGGSGAELLLAPANRSHAGWYACTARNEVNNRTSEPVYLDIVYGPDEPAISVEPFSPEQGSFSAGEREDVVLSCLAPSNPPSRYIWLHNGSQVHIGQTFVMSAIARGQAGTYTCLAENTHLQTRTQATIVLTVYSEPPFEALPAVTGAAVMGMLVATSMSLLAVHCIARHRDRLPRLHELLFRIAGPNAPQLAEDANVAMSTEDGEGQGQEEPGGPSTAAMEEEPRSAPPGDPADDAPVDVTITMTAMP
uniref:Ig-like domain-containing protein n=1 Tax=Gallus gallus TaxID=9031 RepID=A0A8V0ZTV8_CHICK